MKFPVLFLLLCAPSLVLAVDISFKVENLRSNKGQVFVGIYDSPDTFPSGDGYVAYCFNKEKIVDGRVSVTCSVEPGYYAAAMYHDENENMDFDTNFVGIPKEGYGFTNNPKIGLSPPKFEEAAFKVDNQNLEFIVRMKY